MLKVRSTFVMAKESIISRGRKKDIPRVGKVIQLVARESLPVF